jgi:1,2-diacylglycerol 3-beta-galactosyltransferase
VRILILMSDTGGGHRSAAEAIADALTRLNGDSVRVSITDFLTLSGFPLALSRSLYARVIHHPRLWRRIFRLADRPLLPWLEAGPAGRLLLRGIERAVGASAPDVAVSVHPLATSALTRALARLGRSVPTVVIVTDMVCVHTAWAAPQAAASAVATPAAGARLRSLGVPAERISVVGLPVAYRFGQAQPDKSILRQSLGIEPNARTILLVGGGEGAGGMEQQVDALDQGQLGVQMVVVAGRNARLEQQLRRRDWGAPVKVLGFVRNMPELMHTADLLVTKAGPGTISEALVRGLPLIITSALPGQEEGNVGYVVDGGAGIETKTTGDLVQAVRRLTGPEGAADLAKMSACASRLARPQAAADCARLILRAGDGGGTGTFAAP